MRKLFLFLLLSVMSLSMFAQETHECKNIVGVSPFSFGYSLTIKYERQLNGKITCGGFGTWYYFFDPGVQFAPMARYYFWENAPKGFYAQAKIMGGYYSRDNVIYIYDQPHESRLQNLIATEHRKQPYTSFGAGIAVGYQFVWGKDNRWSIDVNAGRNWTNGYPPNPILKDNEELSLGSAITNYVFFLCGAGIIVDGLLSIGYRF